MPVPTLTTTRPRTTKTTITTTQTTQTTTITTTTFLGCDSIELNVVVVVVVVKDVVVFVDPREVLGQHWVCDR